MKSIICIFKKHVLAPLVCALLAIGLMEPPAFAGDMPAKELLAMAGELTLKASQMAVEAKVTDDYYVAQHAFALATEAAAWVGEASAIAQKRSDSELGKAVLKAANEIREVIIHAQLTAREIADTNPDPEVVHAANFLFKSCELALTQFGGPPQK